MEEANDLFMPLPDMESLIAAVNALGLSIEDLGYSFGPDNLPDYDTSHKEFPAPESREKPERKRGERGTQLRGKMFMGYVQRAYRHQSR